MIQTTFKELLQGKLDTTDLEGIYVIRDGEHVLYVGRSTDVVERLHEHIENWPSSAIGDLFMLNRPQSYNWRIELMTPEECRPFLLSRSSMYEDARIPVGIEAAERAMILHYGPSMNGSLNLHPKPLPKHIKRHEIEVGATDHLY